MKDPDDNVPSSAGSESFWVPHDDRLELNDEK